MINPRATKTWTSANLGEVYQRVARWALQAMEVKKKKKDSLLPVCLKNKEKKKPKLEKKERKRSREPSDKGRYSFLPSKVVQILAVR